MAYSTSQLQNLWFKIMYMFLFVSSLFVVFVVLIIVINEGLLVIKAEIYIRKDMRVTMPVQ